MLNIFNKLFCFILSVKIIPIWQGCITDLNYRLYFRPDQILEYFVKSSLTNSDKKKLNRFLKNNDLKNFWGYLRYISNEHNCQYTVRLNLSLSGYYYSKTNLKFFLNKNAFKIGLISRLPVKYFTSYFSKYHGVYCNIMIINQSKFIKDIEMSENFKLKDL